MVNNIVRRKGGSADGVKQTDLRGGNAINVASGLAALGAKVTPVVCTNKFGFQQICHHFRQYKVNTSHVKIFRKASITTALEFKTESGKANVMLRDVGSLADFGAGDLTEKDCALIENSDYVCLFNWAGTLRFGTELATAVFRRVKTSGKGKTYYGTADPAPNKPKIPQLIENVLKSSNVDILSLNENEALNYASILDPDTFKRREKSFRDLIFDAVEVLSKHVQARVDLHTKDLSVTNTGKITVTVPAFNVNALRATGAGDAWDAGNIFGDGNGLSEECRLTLANAVAACYLASPEGIHPTRRKIVEFLKNTSNRRE
jgi:sugar/nucleoside kinase (ribokinase family)